MSIANTKTPFPSAWPDQKFVQEGGDIYLKNVDICEIVEILKHGGAMWQDSVDDGLVFLFVNEKCFADYWKSYLSRVEKREPHRRIIHKTGNKKVMTFTYAIVVPEVGDLVCLDHQGLFDQDGKQVAYYGYVLDINMGSDLFSSTMVVQPLHQEKGNIIVCNVNKENTWVYYENSKYEHVYGISNGIDVYFEDGEVDYTEAKKKIQEHKSGKVFPGKLCIPDAEDL